MSKSLATYLCIFGNDTDINDCELIGVDADGSAIYFNAEEKSVYTDGLKPDEDGELNNREHVIAYPFVYLMVSQNMPLNLRNVPEYGIWAPREMAEGFIARMEQEKEM